MLNKTLEFLRTADPQPTDEKIRKRKQAAQDLLPQLKKNPRILLDFVQGTVAGFNSTPFTQESAAVALLIQTIKTGDETLPHDLKENSVELRAVAAIVVGELLADEVEGEASDDPISAALSLRSALSVRPAAGEKHIKWMIETLLSASDDVLRSAAQLSRKRGTPALEHLERLKETAPTDLWAAVVPAMRSALQEATTQAAIDREELETLWWMFTGYSKVAKKPLVELSPSEAAFCSGIELAERALLPPSPSAIEMVKRAVEFGRKTSSLIPISLQDSTKEWSPAMLTALAPTDASTDEAVLRYPALLPMSCACHRMRGSNNGAGKLGKEFTAATGIPLNHAQSPTEWGAQVFREKILQRVIAGMKES
jgi:hypothetical protein